MRHDDSNWLVSYADMMTLLCGFFIILFSMAKLDADQYESLREALAQQLGYPYTPPHGEMVKYAQKMLHELNIDAKTIVRGDARGVSIEFESTVFFETLSAEINAQGKNILISIIKNLKDREEKTRRVHHIIVEGHTDSRPITEGIYPTNWELSGARASRVVRMFIDGGFSPNYLTAIGYADTHPQRLPEKSDKSWTPKELGKNRRVVLRILDPNADAIPFPSSSFSRM